MHTELNTTQSYYNYLSPNIATDLNLACFVALGCKSERAGLSQTLFKISRVSSFLAQREQGKLIIKNYKVTAIFRKKKRLKCGFMTNRDAVGYFFVCGFFVSVWWLYNRPVKITSKCSRLCHFDCN